MVGLSLRYGVIMVARSTKEGKIGIDGIRKLIDISKELFLCVLEKSESCTESRGWIKVRESRYRAMQKGGPQTGNGNDNESTF